jgi:ABC-type sugar transport system ATPase subunit
MSKGELLRIEHAFKRYDGAIALNDAWLSVMPGEVLALMGENGAGKSTLGKILAGAVQPDSAEITLNGQSVQITSPIAAQRLGIGMVFQELDLFPHLSVAENIVIGNLRAESGSWVNRRQLAAFCRPYLDQVGLPVDPHQLVATLSIGQMQLVAIARALSFGARLILMDEPTSALSDDAVQVLFRLIRQLRASGVSIIYVSHKMKEIFEIADRITVMRDGKTIGSKLAGETDIDEIIQMMVGRALSADSQASTDTPGEVLLRVNGLTTNYIHDVSFDLRRGEILGVAGLVGAGRSEIGAALFGIDKVVSGTVLLHGRELTARNPKEAIRAGFGLLPEDRKLQGLMMQMSVLENSTMATLEQFQYLGFLKPKQEEQAANSIGQELALRAASDKMSVRGLSGGNQQKVLLAKWLLADPEVLFLDDPTRGIDVGAKRDIYKMIHRLADAGKGIIFVSSELPELLGRCHRILVMREGRSAGILRGQEATQEAIMQLATVGGATV